MNNLQEIINDPELYAEFEKAYAMVAPYRAKLQYKLALINLCQTARKGRSQVVFKSDIVGWQPYGYLVLDSETGYKHPDFVL